MKPTQAALNKLLLTYRQKRQEALKDRHKLAQKRIMLSKMKAAKKLALKEKAQMLALIDDPCVDDPVTKPSKSPTFALVSQLAPNPISGTPDDDHTSS